MSIRAAALAVFPVWDGYCANDRSVDLFDVGVKLNELRSALSEPDPMVEACEIIEELVAYAEDYSTGVGDRAREFLKRHGGTK